jgi:hypothetical protein
MITDGISERSALLKGKTFREFAEPKNDIWYFDCLTSMTTHIILNVSLAFFLVYIETKSRCATEL